MLLANAADGSLWMFQACLQGQRRETTNPPTEVGGSFTLSLVMPQGRPEFATSITCRRHSP
jgi:hypothetical protein